MARRLVDRESILEWAASRGASPARVATEVRDQFDPGLRLQFLGNGHGTEELLIPISWDEWFSTVQDPIAYDVRGLEVVAGEDVAFSQSLNHVKTTMQDGELCDTWVRVTVGYRKIDGEWLVVHEHVSVPVEMETGEAALDLAP